MNHITAKNAKKIKKYTGINLSVIAEIANVSRTQLYFYFKNDKNAAYHRKNREDIKHVFLFLIVLTDFFKKNKLPPIENKIGKDVNKNYYRSFVISQIKHAVYNKKLPSSIFKKIIEYCRDVYLLHEIESLRYHYKNLNSKISDNFVSSKKTISEKLENYKKLKKEFSSMK